MPTEPTTGDEPFADLIVGLRAAVPELEPSTSLLPGLRRRYARRTALRRAGYAAVPVALVAAVGVGAMLIPRGGTAPEGARPVVLDAARVTAQVNKALDNASQDILGETFSARAAASGASVPTDEPGQYQEWVSMTTGQRNTTFSVGGKVVFESGFSAPGQFTVVEYQSRTYLTSPDADSGAVGNATFTPAQIRAALASGKLAITARNQQVDGQDTIELTGTLIPADESGPYATAVPQRFWVSATTYLPVRWETRVAQGGWGRTTDFTWLAPTPENEAKLTVEIPAGFTRK